jgi:hypothetical protein
MFNFIGKGLVLVHTLLSLAGLVLAFVIWFEFVDWGRSEPRISRGEPSKTGSTDQRIASEYDRSVVVVKDGEVARNLAVPLMAPAEDSLRETAAKFGPNHLFYVAELKKLREAEGNIEVMAITPDGIALDATGKPILKDKVDGLSKSLAAYYKELAAEIAKVKPIEEEVRKWTEKDAQTSFLLTGKVEDGKQQHGMLELLDQEFKTQQRLREEKDYLLPLWAAAIEEARRFSVRRKGLEDTLHGLEKTLKDRGLK